MQVKCPTCNQGVEWGPKSPFRPFCSKKCQLIDLGEWASEESVISTKDDQADLMKEVDIEEIEAILAQQQDDFFKQ